MATGVLVKCVICKIFIVKHSRVVHHVKFTDSCTWLLEILLSDIVKYGLFETLSDWPPFFRVQLKHIAQELPQFITHMRKHIGNHVIVIYCLLNLFTVYFCLWLFKETPKVIFWLFPKDFEYFSKLVLFVNGEFLISTTILMRGDRETRSTHKHDSSFITLKHETQLSQYAPDSPYVNFRIVFLKDKDNFWGTIPSRADMGR